MELILYFVNVLTVDTMEVRAHLCVCLSHVVSCSDRSRPTAVTAGPPSRLDGADMTSWVDQSSTPTPGGEEKE